MGIPVSLTIAGSDSGGGAGIEADLKAFAALGVHGAAAITSVTAQNTYEVTGVHDMPPEFVALQIRTVHRDLGVDAAKTGMLSNAGIIEAVAETIGELSFPLVVDPVMVAKSGARLLDPNAVDVLVKKLLPLAEVITPNLPEAEVILGRRILDPEGAAEELAKMTGARYVVLKGGHLEGEEAVDYVYHEGTIWRLRSRRIGWGCTHGTGCAFSAAIAAGIAKGLDPMDAIMEAKRFITMAIDYGYHVGRGHCPVNPMASLEMDAERWRCYRSVLEAMKTILRNEDIFLPHCPEVGINVAMALDFRYARSREDVAAVEGRINRSPFGLRSSGAVSFGASSHLASAILTVMQVFPEIRAALNIVFSEEVVERARNSGLVVSSYDRAEEPPDLKALEGMTVRWGISRAISELSGAPDIVYHLGDYGKEPMILVFGRTAEEAVRKALKLISP